MATHPQSLEPDACGVCLAGRVTTPASDPVDPCSRLISSHRKSLLGNDGRESHAEFNEAWIRLFTSSDPARNFDAYTPHYSAGPVLASWLHVLLRHAFRITIVSQIVTKMQVRGASSNRIPMFDCDQLLFDKHGVAQSSEAAGNHVARSCPQDRGRGGLMHRLASTKLRPQQRQ